MTTSIKVTACCSDDEEVKVIVSGDAGTVEDLTLQNGEDAEVFVYDDKSVTVKEIKKA